MQDTEQDFSLKRLFFPLTNILAIQWIIIIGILVYANVFLNGFVWDDKSFIINNLKIHPLNLAYLFSKNAFNDGGYYRPIPAVYFSTLWNLFNNMPFFYHLSQIILHIACTCLLYFFFKRYFTTVLSLILALFFLVHPIQIESVVYIGATQSELLLIFGMTALLFGLNGKIHFKTLFLMSFFLLLTLLTKETGFLFLLMIILYQFLFHRKNLLSLTYYSIGTILIYSAIRFGYARAFLQANTSTPIYRLSLAERIIEIPSIFFYYLKTLFYPIQLNINQRWVSAQLTLQQFYIPLIWDLVFLLLLCMGGIYIYKKNKKHFALYAFFLLWFFSGIALILNIFPLDMTVADRWFYFPLVGLLGMIGMIYQHTIGHPQNIKKTSYSIVIIVLLLLSIRTIERNKDWHDELGLFIHDSKISDNYDIENTIAADYYIKGDYKNAIEHYKLLSTIDPEKKTLSDLGAMYMVLGDKQNAMKTYSRALSSENLYFTMNQNYIELTYTRYIYLLLDNKDYDKALSVINDGLTKYPNSNRLWIEMAYAQYKLHKNEQALQAAKKIKEITPGEQADLIYSQILNGQELKLNSL